VLRKGAIANADFVVTDSADLGETRHGPAISLNYVEVRRSKVYSLCAQQNHL